jgi:PAS domain S-box-containing protein
MTSAGADEGSRQIEWSSQVGLLEHADDAIVQTDRHGRVSIWSRGAERMYGYTESAVLGRDVADVARIALSDEERSEIRRALLDTGRWVGPLAAAHEDGTPIAIELTIVTLRASDEEILGFLGIHRDVTERWRSERRLQDGMRRAEMVLESVTDGILVLDLDWCYTYINERALARLRRAVGQELTREEVLGKSLWQLQPNIVGGRFAQQVREAKHERNVAELVFWFEPTAEFLEARIYPSDDGLTIYFRDVTERTRAERQLAFHAELLESVEDAVLAFDEQFIVTAWNREAEKMFGWTAEEAIGQLVYELNSPSYSDEELAAQLSDLRETGRWRGEAVFYGKHAKPVTVEALTVALRSEDGALTGYLSIVRDVSERWRSRRERESRARQRAIVTDLNFRARASDNVQALLEYAAALVAQILELKLVVVVEGTRADAELAWRAGFGVDSDTIATIRNHPSRSDAIARYTLSTGEPVISGDVTHDERFTISGWLAEQPPMSAIAVVIPGAAEPFGAFVALGRHRRSFTPDDVDLMQTVAEVLGTTLERSDVEERLEQERENERKRIARDLHDEALSQLSDALASAALARATSVPGGDRDRWAQLVASLQAITEQVRSSIYNLRLTGSEDRGLADLLTELIAHHDNMDGYYHVQLNHREALPTETLGTRSIDVLRIIGEAITNARRHSGARSVRVDAYRPSRDVLRLEVSDEGDSPDRGSQGFKPGTGITGMRERAELLGADLRIDSRPGAGTTVRLDLVLAAESPSS